MSACIQSCVAFLAIAACPPALPAQLRRAGPNFDRCGRPIVNIVEDDGKHMTQCFDSSWAALAPVFELEKSELTIAWDPPREPTPGRIVLSGRIEVQGRDPELSPGWYQGRTSARRGTGKVA